MSKTSVGDKILIRVQSAEGLKRIEISPKANLKELFETVQQTLKVDGFGLFKERNFLTELHSSHSQKVGSCLKHGDMLFLKKIAGTSIRRTSTTAIDDFETTSTSRPPARSSKQFQPSTAVAEDEVDQTLSKMDGLIERARDPKACRHNANGRCVHCTPIEPYDDNYLKEQKIKHLSFHSYIRKQKSGIDGGKYVAFDDINCRIKSGCREHPPWPKGICSKCQPSAVTLNRQIYRHVDNIMFENPTIVERFLDYWRTTAHQRMGFLYGTYEVHADVPLGIRATVAAIYEPPQESTRDSIRLLDDEAAAEVDELAHALGLKKVGWIFTDLITDDPAVGSVKQLRGIETHFLTAQECITAGELQNRHPNPCKYASSGYFGSKFVTVCVTGDSSKQVHTEGYAVSAQCMALVRDNCLIPTKDAPELGYVRESTDKQYVPDVYYKVYEKDQYGNEVQRLARPLPVEYLLVDVPASTPLQPQFTFTQYKKRGEPFPVENRYLDGHLQDFSALSTYLSHWMDEEFLEAISDFHLLLFLYRMDTVPLRTHMGPLLEAVRTKNTDLAYSFKASEPWKLLESLIQASTGGVSSGPSASNTAVASSASSAAAAAGANNQWQCNHCTFINPGELSSCEMCSLPR
ncbi:nuclear protein localization protein 4 homolog isoform X1 [Rhagoletis pomonella]|uniref:nuclear protein localization protein 4 homolog isoform X1 n=1 Tax=Rhagoletis pomonella TaxID=28610 RepID=UPI0017812551|nr:nuclear protein localization protein 4 homolog isoform X1 [Rhagoletis pomonella]